MLFDREQNCSQRSSQRARFSNKALSSARVSLSSRPVTSVCPAVSAISRGNNHPRSRVPLVSICFREPASRGLVDSHETSRSTRDSKLIELHVPHDEPGFQRPLSTSARSAREDSASVTEISAKESGGQQESSSGRDAAVSVSPSTRARCFTSHWVIAWTFHELPSSRINNVSARFSHGQSLSSLVGFPKLSRGQPDRRPWSLVSDNDSGRLQRVSTRVWAPRRGLDSDPLRGTELKLRLIINRGSIGARGCDVNGDGVT